MDSRVDDRAADGDLREGARNAVNVCLKVRPEEKVTLITDRQTEEIADSICREATKIGASCQAYVLEDFAPRPHT